MSGSNPARLSLINYEAGPGITPEQAEAAGRCIAERARDAEDAALLLNILFGAPREFHGLDGRRERRRGEPVSAVYQHPMPVGPAGKTYRAAVRAWGREQGLTVKTGGSPQGWLLNAYVEATGNVWNPENTEATTS